MPLNTNPSVAELLSWHGQDRGGIRVPFQTGGSPFGSTIITELILRLRQLANSIAKGQKTPRFIFLVGGPGNGKSETVEDFLRSLDGELQLGGALISILTSRFAPQPLVRRRVEVTAADLPNANQFQAKVGRLVVIQDATATDEPDGDAARALANDVADLLTSNETPLPLFVVCANRGLLARALREASREFGADQDVTKLLISTIKATSLGTEALASKRIPCWPIPEFDAAACWPLDLETLIGDESSASPLMQIVKAATNSSRWQVAGRCSDCDSASRCPFRQNAEDLRESSNLTPLLRLLRRGELATGQRWNFRDAFSLTAELIVGQWSDFQGYGHPCNWVHSNISDLDAEVSIALNANYVLLARLYGHALFPSTRITQVTQQIKREINLEEKPRSQTLFGMFSDPQLSSSKHIRRVLIEQYSALDPAVYTPKNASHELRQIEDNYNQSVAVGNDHAFLGIMTGLEQRFLQELAKAEEEWDVLGRASSQALAVINTLRRVGANLMKRSIGVKHGHHAREDYLQDYAATLRDQDRLDSLKGELQALLGRREFRFDAVESFGQPQEERAGTFTLTGPPPGVKSHPAPQTTSTMPGHDVPAFEFSATSDRIPITFEFYLALRLRAERCVNSSLPASVRAAIDRIRHRYAGRLCRSFEQFADGTVTLFVGAEHKIILAPDGTTKLGKVPTQGAE
jgi:hypothetical protein